MAALWLYYWIFDAQGITKIMICRRENTKVTTEANVRVSMESSGKYLPRQWLGL